MVPVRAPSLLRELAQYVRSPVYYEKLARVEALPPHAAPDAVIAQLGNGAAGHESVPAAVYAFLRSPDSFSTAVHYAVGLGGDTDTIAGMTGALVGAYQGEAAIPETARAHVEGGTKLRALADGLLCLALRDMAEHGTIIYGGSIGGACVGNREQMLGELSG